MLPFIRPAFPEPESWLPHLQASFRARRFSNFGPCHELLESRLSERYAVAERQAVLVANGTAGLTAALLALGVRGRVAVPSFTFPATAHAVAAAGCTPVLCDVDQQTWELTPDTLRQRIRTEGLAGIVHVRAFGFCRDLAPMEQLASDLGIPLVVDAAAALGGQLDDSRPAGIQGSAEVFSLHATKVFAIGEGGLVVTTPDLARRIRQVVNFGMRDGTVDSAGINGKLSELGAAVGLAMLERLDGHVRHRQALAQRYADALSREPRVSLAMSPGRTPWQTFPVRVLGAEPDRTVRAIVEGCLARGVELRRYYFPALHATPYFSPLVDAQPGISAGLSDAMICLPIYSDMSDNEQDEVLAAFRQSLPR